MIATDLVSGGLDTPFSAQGLINSTENNQSSQQVMQSNIADQELECSLFFGIAGRFHCVGISGRGPNSPSFPAPAIPVGGA